MLPGETPGEIYPLDPYGLVKGRRAGQVVRGMPSNWGIDIEIEEPFGPNQPALGFKINVSGPGGGYRSIDMSDPQYANDPRYQGLASYIQQCFNSGNTLTPQEAQSIARMAGFSQVGTRQQEHGRGH